MRAVYLFFSACCTMAHSFTTANLDLQRQTDTALHLVPSQGCQLAAYAYANMEHHDQYGENVAQKALEIDNDHSHPSDGITPTQAAREFASRLFSIPSQINSSHETHTSWITDPLQSASESSTFQNDNEDVVLYPLLGFTFVKTDDGKHVRALPSPNASGVCNIKSLQDTKESPLYGWFSSCCYLGDFDDDDYCKDRRQATVETKNMN